MSGCDATGPGVSGYSGATRSRLGIDRWHFQHGPIDLIIEADAELHADADGAAREHAFNDCWEVFQRALPTLVAELPALKRAAYRHPGVSGPIARRMLDACVPLADERFITPMAAVAGAVADELIESFRRQGVRRAFINNGGDIALLLAPGAEYRIGIWPRLEETLREAPGPRSYIEGAFSIDHTSPVRGIATSGWRGRSQSLGIADSVTVLAGCAAAADAVATLIANAVDCDHAGIVRVPASQVKDDSDLGELPVTVAVPALPATAVAEALARGRAEAERWRNRGLLHAAALFLQGRCEVVMPAAARMQADGALRWAAA
jgi:ApbE superfamily uncharacterized protein (UPF0280 family)